MGNPWPVSVSPVLPGQGKVEPGVRLGSITVKSERTCIKHMLHIRYIFNALL